MTVSFFYFLVSKWEDQKEVILGGGYMQSFTQTEIIWMIGELDKCAASYKQEAENPCSSIEKSLLNLRSENCANLSEKLANVIRDNDKRIEIKH